MSTKENNEVAVEKVTENDKASADAKCDIKGIKRPAEVSTVSLPPSFCYSDRTPRSSCSRSDDVYPGDVRRAAVAAMRATRE